VDELHVVGLSEDEDFLVVAGDDGTAFRLAVDDATSAVAGRSPARTADRYAAARPPATRDPETTMDLTLRPRDIQARIRAGATVDDVIAESSLPRDRVERYAGPMLAERAHVATLARDTEVRRDLASDAPLSRAVAERLTTVGVDEATADWDAWRREDGRWVVRIAYAAGRVERSGHWVFDPRAGSLLADDAEARWLIDPSAPEPEDTERASKPRLASVVALANDGSHDDDAEDLEDLEPDAAEGLSLIEDTPSDVTAVAQDVQATLDEITPEEPEAPVAAPSRAKPTTKRKGRASVPSWDDIVFGSRRGED
jgi:hypothetical protein